MKSIYIYIAIVVIVIGGLVVARNMNEGGGAARVTKYDDFAQCLTDNGARFFGAYWCPHCRDQKKLFDNSKKIPYIECSTPDGKSQREQCITEEIKGYPTWKFADGTVIDQVMELPALAEKTGCVLPPA